MITLGRESTNTITGSIKDYTKLVTYAISYCFPRAPPTSKVSCATLVSALACSLESHRGGCCGGCCSTGCCCLNTLDTILYWSNHCQHFEHHNCTPAKTRFTKFQTIIFHNNTHIPETPYWHKTRTESRLQAALSSRQTRTTNTKHKVQKGDCRNKTEVISITVK